MTAMGNEGTSTFDTAIAFVLTEEGAHADKPADPGGDTWFGLSRRSYPTLTPWPPTRETAILRYKEDFWDPAHLELLPPAVAVALFDARVNQGPGRAVHWLQHLLGVMEDGVIGPVTAAKAASNPGHVLRQFCAYRGVRYTEAKNDHGDLLFPEFGMDWMTRLLDVYRVCLALL